MADADNPFLIPPPPPGIAPQPKSEKAPEPEPIDPDSLIALPPGIVDSGTYRVSAPKVVVPVRREDAPIFVPASPGFTPMLPTTEVDDATSVAVGRRSAPAWRLTLPHAEQLLLERTTLIGRDPAVNAEWPDAALLPVVDPGKTVSKTHAAVELTEGGALLVHDLNSTNGVYLRMPGGDESDVMPGQPVLLELGSELVLGEYVISVDRS
jgi:hypothetical protein